MRRNVVAVIFGLMLLMFGRMQVTGQTPITNREALDRLQMRFITDAYKRTATAKLLEEVNAVAMAMKLDENLPIRGEDLLETRISPPFLSDHAKSFGSVSTARYHYFASVDNKLSYIVRNFGPSSRNEHAFLQSVKSRYLSQISEINTNAAHALAVAWLSSAGVAVQEMERDSKVEILAWNFGDQFVPVYWVRWYQPSSREGGSFEGDNSLEPIAMVQFVQPERLLLQMHVEKPQYLKRKPLTLPNKDQLLQETSDPTMHKVWFTTEAYKKAALSVVLKEANKISAELGLREKMPIEETNLVETMIATPFLAQYQGRFATISTENYVYGFDDYRLSYINRNFRLKDDEPRYLASLKERYPATSGKGDEALAYSLATQWLQQASIDLESLERDCKVRIQALNLGDRTVPVYRIVWVQADGVRGVEAAVVEVLVPERRLQKFWIEKSRYNKRKPFNVPDRDKLLSETNVAPQMNGPGP